MPQTGPDLVGAGYPISRPLLALLGGTGNTTQPNVPIHTNLDFALGGLSDVSVNAASTVTVAVPVVPGAIITKVSVPVGATGASITNGWAALYSGTGSAPGTTGVSPVLIGTSASQPAVAASTYAASVALYNFTFNTPQTITSVQAPFGYIYVSLQFAPAVSILSMTCASIAQYPWYSTSPFSLAMTTASTAASAVPATLGTATRILNPPVVLLS